MKKFTTILLLLIIFLQTFHSFVIQADYWLNKSYIAKVFCINKEKPEMHCNGKCYLTRQLREQEKQEQAPAQKKEKFEVQPFFLPQQLHFRSICFSTPAEYSFTKERIQSAFLHSIFHPPTV